MNTAYKVIMIIVGCVVAYFLMSLATNSQKMVQGISSQGKDLKSIADLNRKIQDIENRISTFTADSRENSGSFNEVRNSIKDNSMQIAEFERNVKENTSKLAGLEQNIRENTSTIAGLERNVSEVSSKITENTGSVNSIKESVAKVDAAVARISAVEVRVDNLGQKSAVSAVKQEDTAVAELRSMLVQFKQDNQQLREMLAEKSELLAALQAEVERNKALLQTLGSAGSDEMNKKLELLLASTSIQGTDVYERVQKEVDGLVIRIDGMKETLGAYKDASIDKIQDLNTDLRKRVDALEQMLGASKEYTLKLLQNVEDSVVQSNEHISGMLAEKNSRVEDEFKVMAAKIADLAEKCSKTAPAPVVNLDIQQYTDKISVELETIKREFAGLERKVAQFMAQDAPEKTEPAGIVVTKTFERSLVMINTPKGTYIFNPYADFTGVVRVRDAGGNEKMVLVPYTGEYLKIGENIIDTGPFARSCVLGINCDIDVRGSTNVPVGK